MMLQVNTFAINYKGHPFMESLKDNKPLLYSLMFSVLAISSLTLGLVPDVADQFSIIEFPAEFRMLLLKVLVVDCAAAFVIDRFLQFCLGTSKLKLQ